MSSIVIVYVIENGELGLERAATPPAIEEHIGPSADLRAPVDIMQHGRRTAGPSKDLGIFRKEVDDALAAGDCITAYGLATDGVGFVDDEAKRSTMFHTWLGAALCEGRAELTEDQNVHARREATALAMLDPNLEQSITAEQAAWIQAWRQQITDGTWWTVTLTPTDGRDASAVSDFVPKDFWSRWLEIRVNGMPVKVSDDGTFHVPTSVVNDIELVHIDGSPGPTRRVEGVPSRDLGFIALARTNAMKLLVLLPEDGAELYVEDIATMPGAEAGVDLIVIRRWRTQYWTWDPGEVRFTRITKRGFRDRHQAERVE
jgi:hypothetical protein